MNNSELIEKIRAMNFDWQIPASFGGGTDSIDPRKGVGPFIRMNFCVHCGDFGEDQPCYPWKWPEIVFGKHAMAFERDRAISLRLASDAQMDETTGLLKEEVLEQLVRLTTS